MISLRKRGKAYHADVMDGKKHVARGSLGTRNQDAARRLVHKIGIAFSEGAASSMWAELQTLLPTATYERFTEFAGVKQFRPATWADLKTAYHIFREQRIELGKFARSTSDRYEISVCEFGEFLGREKVSLLKDINKPLVAGFSSQD